MSGDMRAPEPTCRDCGQPLALILTSQGYTKACGCPIHDRETLTCEPLADQSATPGEMFDYFSGMAAGVNLTLGMSLWTETDGPHIWLRDSPEDGTERESPHVLRTGWRSLNDVYVAFSGMLDALTAKA